MASKGDLLELLEARERANRDLHAQDDVIMALQEKTEREVNVRNELYATWRLVNNELALAATQVFPADGVLVESD